MSMETITKILQNYISSNFDPYNVILFEVTLYGVIGFSKGQKKSQLLLNEDTIRDGLEEIYDEEHKINHEEIVQKLWERDGTIHDTHKITQKPKYDKYRDITLSVILKIKNTKESRL